MCDSNIPLYRGELTRKEQEANRDIINNCYILFTKDLTKSWNFLYDPIICGKHSYEYKVKNDIYYNYFNSFIPGTTLVIYCM